MHEANLEFWRQNRETYNHYFHKKDVIECGSMDMCGTVRQFFSANRYIGVDWRPGKGVDLVSLVHDLKFKDEFDVVISASMLEHDPHWDKSIRKMVSMLKDSGILLLSWGAAENGIHCLETATDGQFHALPVGRVFEILDELGVYVHRFVYEETLLGGVGADAGCVALVAFKDPSLAVGDRSIAPLKESDK